MVAGVNSSPTATYHQKQKKPKQLDHLSLPDFPSHVPTKITFYLATTTVTYFK
jgi:hypothetical protein